MILRAEHCNVIYVAERNVLPPSQALPLLAVPSPQVRATSSGRVTAVPFWYEIHLDPEVSVSTLSQDSHWKQAAVVLQPSLEVRTGDWVCLAVQLHKSSISMSARIDNEDASAGLPAVAMTTS